MSLVSKAALAALLVVVPSLALAAPLTLGKPAYGGPGCPSGSASTTLSPDRKSLSISFSRFSVEAGGAGGDRLGRKACSLAIPVAVPEGFSVSVLKATYAGYNQLPAGASAQFNAEYFFAGGQGPKFSRSFKGPLVGSFSTGNAVGVTAWSDCGADVILRVNASLLVTSTGAKARAAIDRASVKSAIVYQLDSKAC